MSRPRSISDDALLDSVRALLRRAGPSGVTFATMAAETGLAGATLVQRFGSKPAMVQAALLRGWDLLDARTAACDAAAPESPAGAVAMLVALSSDHGEEEDGAAELLLLRENLQDEVLRRRGAAWAEALAAALGRRLGSADKPRPDLGRLLLAQWHGEVLGWGLHREGRLTDAVARALGAWCLAVGLPLAAPVELPERRGPVVPDHHTASGPAPMAWRKRPIGG